ncbi:protein kinase family protein [Paenibacillus sp. FSL H8-0259]|uniref:protein kinase family protein n=1 Tax=Paenibacillus sp. FSL H8-0259 TaxID=1920423 RepID=UPI00096C2067|nr:protein kinase family protein [Paenibacillus sp. FSL H8-0259]OMF30986.1 hypothetical protein BK132_06025 [Paenibacillus sp. FSL H8-0259]
MNPKILNEDEILVSGKKFRLNNIKFLDYVGSGKNGSVFKCLNTLSNQQSAIKIWLPRRPHKYPDVERFAAEIVKLSILDHSNVVRIKTADKINKICYAEMEFVNGITLRDWLKENSGFEERIKVARDLINTMDYVHSLPGSIYHGDLHSENIMIAVNNKIKILDFGTSIFSPDTSDLRASWQLARTLDEILNIKDSAYFQLLDKPIQDFLTHSKFNSIQTKYTDNYKADIVNASFEIIITLMIAEVRYLNTSINFRQLLIDIGHFLLKSPFLDFTRTQLFLLNFINQTDLKSLYDGILHALYDLESIDILMNIPIIDDMTREDIIAVVESLPILQIDPDSLDAKRPDIIYESTKQYLMGNIEVLKIWRKIYVEYTKYLNIPILE